MVSKELEEKKVALGQLMDYSIDEFTTYCNTKTMGDLLGFRVFLFKLYNDLLGTIQNICNMELDIEEKQKKVFNIAGITEHIELQNEVIEKMLKDKYDIDVKED